MGSYQLIWTYIGSRHHQRLRTTSMYHDEAHLHDLMTVTIQFAKMLSIGTIDSTKSAKLPALANKTTATTHTIFIH